MTIVKTIRKFIGQNSYTEIKMYCCKPMQEFIELLRDGHCETELHVYIDGNGLHLHIDNTHLIALVYHSTIGFYEEYVIDKDFIFKFCPFCGGKIEYYEEIKEK